MGCSFICTEKRKFSTYYAIYTSANIWDSFDWNDMLESVSGKQFIFVIDKESIIGGFTLTENKICFPFTISSFDRELFWEQVINYVSDNCPQRDIAFDYIPEIDTSILTGIIKIDIIQTKRRMARPTDKTFPKLSTVFCFDEPVENDKDEIIQVVYEAHLAGYTARLGQPDIAEIEDAINRRFDLFAHTNTLNFSTLVKQKESKEIVGVCIAGIYPDSPNNFSTIHQVSVRPSFRRQGIAEAMMLRTIDKANGISPVITLGVMVGNPAELLYEKIGFRKGASFSELRIMRSSQVAMNCRQGREA